MLQILVFIIIHVLSRTEILKKIKRLEIPNRKHQRYQKAYLRLQESEKERAREFNGSKKIREWSKRECCGNKQEEGAWIFIGSFMLESDGGSYSN